MTDLELGLVLARLCVMADHLDAVEAGSMLPQYLPTALFSSWLRELEGVLRQDYGDR